jgi:aklavinone 12-hydroxylase
VLSDEEPAQPLDDPHARSWLAGTRVPHVALPGDGGETSSLDAAGLGFAVLASDGLDLWRRAAAEASESLGVDIAVRPADADSLAAAAEQAGTAGSGWTGAALIRPDGVIAWKPQAPATESAGQLGGVMASLLSRGTP